MIGAGELGAAVGALVSAKGAAPVFWDADPSKVPNQKPLEEVLGAADAVFFCVPSWVMRKALAGALPHLKPGVPVVSFAKGVEEGTLKTMAELFDELAPDRPRAVVSGPMLAEEISAGKCAVGVVASKDAALRRALGGIFSLPQFRAEFSDDPMSVCLAGVLKNVYAVALGIADGLGASENEKGWLTGRAIREMGEVLASLGADPAAALGPAGAADLIATGYSAYSRNREVGNQIVKFGKCDLRGEGLSSLPPLVERLTAAGKSVVAFPFLGLVNEVGIQCRPAEPAFRAFFGDAAPA